MRIVTSILLSSAATVFIADAQTDWPIYGHDPGGQQFSPLKQIDTSNVTKLRVAWTYDTRPVTPPPVAPPAAPAEAPPVPAPVAGGAAPRNRASHATPLVAGGVMYLSTPYNRVVALEPETGKKIWEYEMEYTPSTLGIAYYPG